MRENDPPAPYFDGTQICAQVDADLFFPEVGGSAEAARRLCRSCDFETPCLEYALRYDVAGVWGGTSEIQRRRIRHLQGLRAERVTWSFTAERIAKVRAMAARGLSNPDIAVALGISRAAVEQIRIRANNGNAA